ncbi:MAG: FimB/Mfa2 family fimbrial subunit, partial [Massilibacteroides sp.]|nr:FimB/Mfa2 family fimbrial subunit [Massilibacteroides sp.]
MKIKIVFGALLAGVVLACSDEVAREKTNPVLPEGTAALKITFSTGDSGSGLKSYADDDELKKGLEAERQIDSVRLYVFDNAGILEQIVMVRNADLEDASSGDAKEATVLLNVEGEKDIVAIANPGTLVSDESVSPIGMAFIDFEKLVTTSLLKMPATPFVMYGIATNQTLTLTQETPVSFELSRIVARVDIVNRDSAVTAEPDQVTKPFVLQKARLTGVYTSAKFNGAVNPDGQIFSGTVDWVDNPNATYMGTMRHALYAFPTPANNAVLELSGTYGGEQAFYQVKFGTLDLTANHLYTVFIDSMTTTTVNATIKVTDWANDTIDYQPVVGEYLSVTNVEVSNASTMSFIADAATNPATVTDTVRMTSLDEGTLTVTVGSSNLAANFFSSADWVTQTAVEPLTS